MTTSRFLALVCALAVANALPAGASLIGDTVGASVTGIGIAITPGSAVVATPGVEFRLLLSGTPYLAIDVDAYSADIAMTVPNVGIFWLGNSQTVTLSDLDFAGFPAGLAHVTIADSAGILNLSQADISFGAHSVTLNLTGQGWDPLAHVRLAFDVGQVSSVPAPASVGLLAAGLFGLGAARRRRVQGS